MKYKLIGNYLPKLIANPLFGNRVKYGSNILHDDIDWLEWQKLCMDFYKDTQKQGIGKKINDAGYEVLGEVSFDDKEVMEIGPGLLPHYKYWRGRPSCYHVIDVRQEFINQSIELLTQLNIKSRGYKTNSSMIPLEDDSVDIVVSFYNLEHLNPLSSYLDEIKRVLRPKGLLVGAIPCEGGGAWGLGRLLTTRRYVNKKGINYDKIICWEHPNFADTILEGLDLHFSPLSQNFWPVKIPIIDINLVIKFVYSKSELF